MNGEKLYQNKEWLVEEYVNKKRSLTEIAGDFNVVVETIRYFLVRFQIPRRKPGEFHKDFPEKRRIIGEKARIYDPQESINMYNAGMPAAEVARVLKCSANTVLNHLRNAGIEIVQVHRVPCPGNSKITDEARREIGTRYLNHENAKAIAKSMNLSIQTICNCLKRLGIPRRPNGSQKHDISRTVLVGIVPDKAIQKRDGDRVAQEMIYNILQPKQS